MEQDLTRGSLFEVMLRFSVPYLIASFLQTFYGMADLYITGQFNASAAVTAVSVGSQVMHMLTVVIVGLVMGTTVSISHSVGAGARERVGGIIGNSVVLFALFAAVLTALLLVFVEPILTVLQTPPEAREGAKEYLILCFAGVPFITAYNVISGIFRGLGDTKRPMIFVFIAGVFNIVLDYVFIGPLGLGARGAAMATVIAQAASVGMALLSLRSMSRALALTRESFRPAGATMGGIVAVGGPIAAQDGLIQVSFLVITAIANARGVDMAAAVGIVEKIISFLFLVPSAMLSTVSAVAAQNAGAAQHRRSKQALRYGIITCVLFGAAVCLLCQGYAKPIVGIFLKKESIVTLYGAQYLRSYSLDCVFAGIHFCFSGFFSAYNRSMYSFAHNIVSILLARIPLTYLASVLYPTTLLPMGFASPIGSLLSALICVGLYLHLRKKDARLA